jgi:MFS family permease
MIAGFGLAGEVGSSVALITETLSKERRGFGVIIIAAFGFIGAIFGGVLAEVVSWRNNLRIGGAFGFLLLILRISVRESEIFKKAKQATDDVPGHSITRGDFLALFTDRKRFIRYISCLIIGLPIQVGVLILVA